jgi:beta-lactamase regulating signal transducer with metallopeptidase domain
MPRLKTARHRYWAAYGALTALFVTALCTLGWVYEPAVALEEVAGDLSLLNQEVSVQVVGSSFWETSIWQSFTSWLETNHALIVALWLLGFGVFLLRLGGGLWQVHRLRTQRVSTPDADWLERFRALQERLGFNKAVQLLESAMVQTPMAIGWLKPVVLLPIGLVNRLSVAEVEAILAHELAHIARRDWIFNLLQAFIESLFYFHPAVWWISAVVRRERENCCDDAALAATGNPLAFAKALVQVQEMATPVPVLALGLSGTRRRPLLDRVRRILNQPQQRQSQVMEKITATVILLALLALVGLKANSVPTLEAAFSQISDIPGVFWGDETTENDMASDSLPKPKNTRKITREDDDQRVEAEYRDGKLVRLNIDGKEIPEAEFEDHEALVEELETDLEAPIPPTPPTPPGAFGVFPGADVWEVPAPAMAPMPPFPPYPAMAQSPFRVISDKDAQGNTIIRLDNAGDATEVVVKDGDVYVNGKKLEKGESLDIPGVAIMEAPGGFSYGFGSSAAYSEDVNREMAQAREESARAYEEASRAYQRDAARSQKEWEKSQKEWEQEQKNWEKEQRKWQKDQEKWQKEQQVWERKNQATQELIKKELLKDGLITDPNDFSMMVNDQEMKVNKKKQPEEIRRKYLELLEKNSGQKLNGNGSFFYNFSDDDK